MSIIVKDASMYIRNWENIADFFNPTTISTMLSHFNLSDFSVKKDVPIQDGANNMYERLGYYKKSEKPLMQSITEYSDHNGGGWSRIVSKPCYTWVVPDSYQLKEAEMIREGLLIEFPYLKNFSFKIYHFDSPATENGIEKKRKDICYPFKKDYYGMELYLDVNDDGSPLFLYVPLVALHKKNKNIIINRHVSYHESYYGKSPERAKYLAIALSALTKEKTVQFFNSVESF